MTFNVRSRFLDVRKSILSADIPQPPYHDAFAPQSLRCGLLYRGEKSTTFSSSFVFPRLRYRISSRSLSPRRRRYILCARDAAAVTAVAMIYLSSSNQPARGHDSDDDAAAAASAAAATVVVVAAAAAIAADVDVERVLSDLQQKELGDAAPPSAVSRKRRRRRRPCRTASYSR